MTSVIVDLSKRANNSVFEKLNTFINSTKNDQPKVNSIVSRFSNIKSLHKSALGYELDCTKPEVTPVSETFREMNLDLTRDLINRINRHRGIQPKVKELKDIVPSVCDPFMKHAKLLFPS